jgi:hypothetical protein
MNRKDRYERSIIKKTVKKLLLEGILT